MWWYCYNYDTASYQLLREEFYFGTSYIYEEAIIWGINKKSYHYDLLFLKDVNELYYYSIYYRNKFNNLYGIKCNKQIDG